MSSQETYGTATFESSHVGGAFSSGQLDVVLHYRAADARQTSFVACSFTVPTDFHTHNDCVAAALMTLIGARYPVVRFNFAISEYCAAILREFYALRDIGPVDPSLEPRRPGRNLALNFSGGVDSTATLVLLREVLDEDVKVITSDYGWLYQREAQIARAFAPDVLCETDFRMVLLDQGGRFNCAVPLLYADYLDLHSLAHGHCYFQYPLSMENLSDGAEPKFRDLEPALRAGGLEELHLVRCLTMAGLAALLARHAPQRVDGALHGSARPGTPKAVMKGLMLLRGFYRNGLPAPRSLVALSRSRLPPIPIEYMVPMIYTIKQLDVGIDWRALIREISVELFEPHDRLTMDFFGRYNTNLIRFIPERYRARALAAFHQAGIMPYSETEYLELQFLREEAVRQHVDLEGVTPTSFRADQLDRVRSPHPTGEGDGG